MVEKTEFREAMAHIAAAVNVVTTDGPEGRCGYTCTALCSVTDDPATVLVCLNRSSAMNNVFRKNGVFCINVLSGEQSHVSQQFAGMAGVSMEERFMNGDWAKMPSGAPAHRHAVCVIDCEIIECKDVGTHSILFGRVLDLKVNAEEQALVYCNRAYHAVPLANRTNI
ncbi:flavin reductase [Rhizobium sp.]|jgi:4-hydroxyphenylacetate 3-monooxygenase reductase component|uniref:flavin reductase n=1 Tax=Rhizobium sp. TaxID=391 RepID=UPI000E911984|nr:flavin reductase [Rhizobium sp.]